MQSFPLKTPVKENYLGHVIPVSDFKLSYLNLKLPSLNHKTNGRYIPLY